MLCGTEMIARFLGSMMCNKMQRSKSNVFIHGVIFMNEQGDLNVILQFKCSSWILEILSLCEVGHNPRAVWHLALF